MASRMNIPDGVSKELVEELRVIQDQIVVLIGNHEVRFPDVLFSISKVPSILSSRF